MVHVGGTKFSSFLQILIVKDCFCDAKLFYFWNWKNEIHLTSDPQSTDRDLLGMNKFHYTKKCQSDFKCNSSPRGCLLSLASLGSIFWKSGFGRAITMSWCVLQKKNCFVTNSCLPCLFFNGHENRNFSKFSRFILALIVYFSGIWTVKNFFVVLGQTPILGGDTIKTHACRIS